MAAIRLVSLAAISQFLSSAIRTVIFAICTNPMLALDMHSVTFTELHEHERAIAVESSKSLARERRAKMWVILAICTIAALERIISRFLWSN